MSSSKWQIFSNSLLFSGKTAFLQISADFLTRFVKFFFHLKDLQKRMQIDVEKFFVAQVIPRYTRKLQQLDVFLLLTVYGLIIDVAISI